MRREQLRPVEVLLVEPIAADANAATQALGAGEVRKHICVAPDGEAALRFLRRESEFASAPRPDFILLDLDSSRHHGFDFLEEVKNDPELSPIPVMVFTAETPRREVEQILSLGANCCVRKPAEPGEFASVLRLIDHFWFSIVSLPRTSAHPSGNLPGPGG